MVIGAGFAGMYMLHKLRGQGLNVRVLEAGSGVGGTWYWNRYPGARCDVPSMEYSYSFDQDIEQEWNWSEVMAAQPEILRYANHVADKLDLKKSISFDTHVTETKFNETRNVWQVTADTGLVVTASFCVCAVGCLSSPNDSPFSGSESNFKGPIYHTGRWPKEPVDFSGKKIAVIGTGSSGIQAIPVLAQQCETLTVLQRTPQYTVPAGNRPMTKDYMQSIKDNYHIVRKAQRESKAGIVSGFGGIANEGLDFTVPDPDDMEKILDLTEEQRQQYLDEMGFKMIMAFPGKGGNTQVQVQVQLQVQARTCALDTHTKV